MSIGDFPEHLNQTILVGRIVVGRLGVLEHIETAGTGLPARPSLTPAAATASTAGVPRAGAASFGFTEPNIYMYVCVCVCVCVSTLSLVQRVISNHII